MSNSRYSPSISAKDWIPIQYLIHITNLLYIDPNLPITLWIIPTLIW